MTDEIFQKLIDLLSTDGAEGAYAEIDSVISKEHRWIVPLVEAFEKTSDTEKKCTIANSILGSFRYPPAENHLRKFEGWTDDTFKRLDERGQFKISAEEYATLRHDPTRR
jgi:hypothetical protein